MGRPGVKGITIDDKSTWDIDDAIWVEEVGNGFLVHVSIADVSKYVPVGSSLDKLAEERVGTQYFRTGNSPMLPRALAEHRLSLWPNRPKKTMTVRIAVDADLSIQSRTVFKSQLKSFAKLSYDQIPALLGDEKSPHRPVLLAAKKLADGLLAKRRANGAMVLYDLNHGWVTTEEGHIRQLQKREDTVGYIIIQELMILANSQVATWAMDKGIPILFRNHEGKEQAPDRAELLKQIEDALHTPLADLTFLRQKTHTLLERAKYEGSVKGHYGLNLPAYTHFTSPIRRYADLVTHQQIRAHLKGEKLPYTAEEFDRIGATIIEKIDQLQKLRGEQAKAKAEKRANRDIELRRLDGLRPKEFERATKVQVRSGEDADPNFVEGFINRLDRNEVPIICAAIVLVQAPDTENWVCLKHAIIRALGSTPEAAISLHGVAKQGLGWPDLTHDVRTEGPSHAPVFTATAKLMFDEALEGPEYTAAVSKIAKQCATVALFAQLVGAPVPDFKQAPPPAPVAVPKSAGPEFDFSKQPISALMEWCQATKTPFPEFEFEQSGPPHMPTIKCTIKVAGISKTTTAGSKQDAKALAAAAAIGALSKQPRESV